ncbi:hypothetical protein AN958_12729 [Leucoagaricus sp. SymC.cos]|nr:hypothetical protein AN958_12729 [Leucoagaricus sp. SymC.cos]
MSAKEYYESAPGERVQSPDSYWKGGQPTHSTPPSKQSQQRKSSRDDYISPGDPSFTLTNFPPSFGKSPTTEATATDAIPVPPPKLQSTTTNVQSPPAPESPGSQVTDDSDDSLVHINLPPRNLPTRTTHRSDSLSLTQSNLHQHNGVGTTGISTPLRGDYSSSAGFGSSTRRRLRQKELGTHGKDTLIQMLIKQECSTDDSRKLLRGALDKLEQYKLDLLEANNHCRRLERACQKLTDERMTMHTQVTEAMGKAQQQVLTAQQELSICKLRLEHTEQSLTTTQAELREARLQRDTAKLEAEHHRNEAHRIREQSNVREAREQGRKSGFDEGVQQGRILGITQSGSSGTPRQLITQAGEPLSAQPRSTDTSIIGENGALVEDPNSSQTSAGRARSSSSKHNSVDSAVAVRDPRTLKAEFGAAVERARKETEDRLQRELENRLNQERHRLEVLNLQQQQRREREIQEEKERLKHLLEESEKARLSQLKNEVRQELREREQAEREREREERQHERDKDREHFQREREKTVKEREHERRAAAERDRERDRAVSEATARAAAATAAANAAANAAASLHALSETSGSEYEHSGPSNTSIRSFPIPPLPYIPMPRPPMDMPAPMTTQPPVTIPAQMAMPEPTVNPMINVRPNSISRPATTQPGLPTTVPARQGRNRRMSIDSQSSISTVTGAFDSLVSFPHAARTNSASGSVGGGPTTTTARGIPGVASSTGSNGGGGGRPTSGSGSRGGAIYGRPYVGGREGGGNGGTTTAGPYSNPMTGGRQQDALSDIPEDASVRAISPEQPRYASVVPPLPVLNMPVIPGVTTSSGTRGGARGAGDVYGAGPSGSQQPMNLNLLNTRNGGLKRSDSANSARPSIRSNSSYEFHIEPPSNPTSPRGGPEDPQEPPLHTAPPTHPHSSPNQFLSPLHATVPIPPPQPPVRIEPSSTSERRQRTRTRTSSSGSRGGRDMEALTEPSSPVIPTEEARDLPLGFVPQTITDTVTGVVTPLTGVSALPSVGGAGGGGGGGGSKPGGRNSGIYSPYTTSSSALPSSPPVIPQGSYGDNTGNSNRTTPSQRTGIYGGGGIGTPATGSNRNLPGTLSGRGTPAPVGGGVYQNPLRGGGGDGGEGEEGEEGESGDGVDELLVRNTKINATAPLPQDTRKKKKKKGGK